MLKSIIATLIFLFSLNISHAEVTANDPEASEETLVTEKEGGETASTEILSKEHPDDNAEDIKTHEKDSSEYSVNKFNYLFYLIYKIKYLDFEEEKALETEVGVQ